MTHRHFSCGLIAYLLACACAPGAAADPRPKPFQIPQDYSGAMLLAPWLEQELGSIVSGCLGGGQKLNLVAGGSKGDVSAVHREIIRTAGLPARPDDANGPKLDKIRHGANAFLFGYVFKEDEWQSPNWSAAQQLIVKEGDRSQIPVFGLPAFTQVENCDTIIGGALEMNASYSLPVASANAALKAAINRNSKVSAHVAYGEFRSPIWLMWTGNEINNAQRDAAKFFAALTIWDWYTRNEAAAKDHRNNIVVASFNGVSIYRFTESEQASDIDAKLKAAAGLGFISGSANTNLGAGRTSRLNTSDYRYAILLGDNGAPRLQWARLPPLRDVTAAIANLKRVKNVDDGVISAQSEADQSFYLDLFNVPAAYCADTAWQERPSVPASAGNGATLRFAGARSQDEIGTCRLHYIYNPGEVTADRRAEFQFPIVSRSTVSGQSFSILSDLVKFDRSTIPSLGVRDGAMSLGRERSRSGNLVSIGWDLTYALRDGGLIDSAEDLDVGDLTLRCPGGELNADYPSFNVTIAPPPISTTVKRVRLEVVASHYGPVANNGEGATICTLGGSIRYRLGTSTVYRAKSFPETKILFPSIVPPPATQGGGQ